MFFSGRAPGVVCGSHDMDCHSLLQSNFHVNACHFFSPLKAMQDFECTCVQTIPLCLAGVSEEGIGILGEGGWPSL